jgi:hypothetical protein
MLPLLQSQVISAVVDPREFKTDSEYLFAQKTAWAYGQSATELLNMIDARVKESEYLLEKEQGKHEDKLRESMG